MCAARAGTCWSTRAGARENIFIAFLAELGNFKPFEAYLFFGDFLTSPDRQFGDLAGASLNFVI